MVENKRNRLQKESVPSEMQQSTGFQGSKGQGGLQVKKRQLLESITMRHPMKSGKRANRNKFGK